MVIILVCLVYAVCTEDVQPKGQLVMPDKFFTVMANKIKNNIITGNRNDDITILNSGEFYTWVFWSAIDNLLWLLALRL